MENKEMEFEFLCRSISDKQTTIRGIDVKCGFLLIIAFYPIAELGKAYEVYRHVAEISGFYYCLVTLAIVSWVLSLWAIFICATAINNPGKNIHGEKPEGLFYNSGLFRIGFRDYFFNFRNNSRYSFPDYLNKLRERPEGALEELLYENMKLAYIRDLKSRRVSFCFNMVLFWLVVGIFLWAIFIGTGGNFEQP